MTIWVDAQMSPVLAPWLTERFGVESRHVRDLGLLVSSDSGIFTAARAAGAVVLTKDRDFVDLVHRRGVPPRLIWITCGNTSNAEMFRILERTLEKALELLKSGEELVEVKG
jgi:predicted nuclease of predicted toxin-antitoxin system